MIDYYQRILQVKVVIDLIYNFLIVLIKSLVWLYLIILIKIQLVLTLINLMFSLTTLVFISWDVFIQDGILDV